MLPKDIPMAACYKNGPSTSSLQEFLKLPFAMVLQISVRPQPLRPEGVLRPSLLKVKMCPPSTVPPEIEPQSHTIRASPGMELGLLRVCAFPESVK